jgi:hypothetical protein
MIKCQEDDLVMTMIVARFVKGEHSCILHLHTAPANTRTYGHTHTPPLYLIERNLVKPLFNLGNSLFTFMQQDIFGRIHYYD